MKLNLTLSSAQVAIARKPELGWESEVYFAAESCVELGTVLCTTAAVGEYTPAGGLGIPTGGRDVLLRCLSPCAGTGGAMAVTFNVTLDDDSADTAVATFQIPTYTDAVNLNFFPIGCCSDFVPTTVGNVAKKIKTIGTLVSVANMTAGNRFQLYCVPNSASFNYISCTTSKAGKFNLPKVIEIPSGNNAAAFTKSGRSESNMVSIGFKDRGVLEQLNRFTGAQGTIRLDVIKDATVLSNRILYSGVYIFPSTERGDGDDVVEAKTEGPYEQFLYGYARVSG